MTKTTQSNKSGEETTGFDQKNAQAVNGSKYPPTFSVAASFIYPFEEIVKVQVLAHQEQQRQAKKKQQV